MEVNNSKYKKLFTLNVTFLVLSPKLGESLFCQNKGIWSYISAYIIEIPCIINMLSIARTVNIRRDLIL